MATTKNIHISRRLTSLARKRSKFLTRNTLLPRGPFAAAVAAVAVAAAVVGEVGVAPSIVVSFVVEDDGDFPPPAPPPARPPAPPPPLAFPPRPISCCFLTCGSSTKMRKRSCDKWNAMPTARTVEERARIAQPYVHPYPIVYMG